MEPPIDQPEDTAAVSPTAGPVPVDRSRPMRLALAVIGTISLALGVLGIVLPVLPTTPFLLLAAACYARASTRMYGWLLGQPTLGPIIAEWRASGSMARGVRSRAIVVTLVTFGLSIWFVEEVLLRALLAATGAIVTLLLSRIPTTPAPPAAT